MKLAQKDKCQTMDCDADAEDDFDEFDVDRTYILEGNETVLGNMSMDVDKSVEMNENEASIYAPAESNANEIKQKLMNTMESLYEIPDELESQNKLVSKQRVIVSIDKLQELKGKHCTVVTDKNVVCGKLLLFSTQTKGSVAQIYWSCENEHFGTWKSSEVVSRSCHTDIYLNDLLVTACVLLSGNNYGKFIQICNFLNLAVPAETVFCRNQRHFFVPVIMEMWESMKSRIVKELSPYNDLILGGDGRNDSPGFSARYCVYVAMDLVSQMVVDFEVLDQRETGGVATNMEREGMTRILERLMKEIDISEIVTDASTSIMKRISDLKGRVFSLFSPMQFVVAFHHLTFFT